MSTISSSTATATGPPAAADTTTTIITSPQSSTTNATAHANEAASRLVEEIDNFLAEIERKLKRTNEDTLAKLDEMSERCDRLEQDMVLRDLSSGAGAGAGGGGAAGKGIGGD